MFIDYIYSHLASIFASFYRPIFTDIVNPWVPHGCFGTVLQ